jgi:hypothetical protein
MKSLQSLLHDVADARSNFIKTSSGLSAVQASFKPSPDAWCITENVEHMFWAEHGAINGMWKTYEAFKSGKPLYTGALTHHGLSVEEIVSRTWKEKEIVPEVAKPRLGGPIEFWNVSLQNLQLALTAFAKAVEGSDLEKIIHPHPISGPLNIIQRFEFLRFHLDRHRKQIENIKADKNYPRN